MPAEKDIAERLEALESRLATVEAAAREAQDRLELLNLIAASAYLPDGGGSLASLFTDDGEFDLIPIEAFPTSPDWPEATADDVVTYPIQKMAQSAQSTEFAEAQKRQRIHAPSMAHVSVDGDTATVVNFVLVFERDAPAEPADRMYRTIVVAVNRFDCHRTADGWRVAHRSGRVLGGRQAHALMAQWVDEMAT